jgi:hypothetical protein
MGLVWVLEYRANASQNTISRKITITPMRSVLLEVETCSLFVNCCEKEEISLRSYLICNLHCILKE